jgi:hypothetical protein
LPLSQLLVAFPDKEDIVKKLLALVGVVLAVLVGLPILQTCNVPALQAQAMIEQAKASSEIAKAAQEAANSANTLAWTLGGSVALLTIGIVALAGLWIFLRVRRELHPQEPVVQLVPSHNNLPRQSQQPQLVPGDPIQQLIQLQTLQMLQGMNNHQQPLQLPARRVDQVAQQDQDYEW